MIEVQHLQIFLTIAEELHVGRAARRLDIAESALGQQLRQLEETVGTPLFIRARRQLSLTDAGTLFVEGAQRTMDELGRSLDAVRRVGNRQATVLRLGHTAYAAQTVMPAIVRRFRGECPSVLIDLVEDSSQSHFTAVHQHALDIALVTGPVDTDATTLGGLRVEPVYREQFFVALPARHALTVKRQVPLRALAGEPFVLFPRQSATRFHDLIVAACTGAGFTPRVVHETVGYSSMVDLVAAGRGVCLVPASTATVAREGVEFRPLTGMTATADISMLYHGTDASAVLMAFVHAGRSLAGRYAYAGV